jgi:hypothetical protein
MVVLLGVFVLALGAAHQRTTAWFEGKSSSSAVEGGWSRPPRDRASEREHSRNAI